MNKKKKNLQDYNNTNINDIILYTVIIMMTMVPKTATTKFVDTTSKNYERNKKKFKEFYKWIIRLLQNAVKTELF